MSTGNERLDAFLAKIKNRKAETIRRLCQPPERDFPLDASRRAENLRLLRAYMNVRQEDLCKTLRLNNQSYYSAVERGEKQLAEWEARRIETDLSLPPGWMDRNNVDGLLLSRLELQLINELRHAPAGTIESLTAFAKGMKAANVVAQH